MAIVRNMGNEWDSGRLFNAISPTTLQNAEYRSSPFGAAISFAFAPPPKIALVNFFKLSPERRVLCDIWIDRFA